jgi:hypothetical protein
MPKRSRVKPAVSEAEAYRQMNAYDEAFPERFTGYSYKPAARKPSKIRSQKIQQPATAELNRHRQQADLLSKVEVNPIAKHALRKLLAPGEYGDGCELEKIARSLYWIEHEQMSLPSNWYAMKNHTPRKIRDLIKHMNRWADVLESLISEISSSPFYREVGKELTIRQRARARPEWQTMPQVLREAAQALSEIRRTAPLIASKLREACRDGREKGLEFVAYIHLTTGNPNYSRAAKILSAAYPKRFSHLNPQVLSRQYKASGIPKRVERFKRIPQGRACQAPVIS